MKLKYWAIILILILATALRFYNLTSISLWHDEAFSALLIKYPWGEMMYRIGLDVHPPMYYIFLRVWYYIFGDSLFALRSMSVFFGVATVWVSWLFVKEAFTHSTGSGFAKSEKMALWAALLVAVNPFSVQYVTEARMYTMGAFFAVLAAYFLTKSLRSHTLLYDTEKMNMPNLPEAISFKRKMFWSYFGFIVSMVVLIYTHYYLLFTAAAIGFYGLVYLYFHHEGPIKKYLWLLLSFIVIGLSFTPWLKIFLFQYKQVGAGYWIPPMDRWSIPSTLWTLIVGFGHDVNNLNTQKWLIVVTLLTLFVIYRFLRKIQSFEKWLVLLAVIAPFTGAVLFYLLNLKCQNVGWIGWHVECRSSSIFLVRYFLYTAAFFSIVLALWFSQIKFKIIGYTLIILYVGANLFTINNYWYELNISSKPGINGAVKYLKANMSPNDKLYVDTSFEFFNLKYYLGQCEISNRPLLYTGGSRDIKNMPHYAGTAILTNEDLLPDFNENVKPGDKVWVLWTNAFGYGDREPNVPNNWTRLMKKGYEEVRPYPGAWVFVREYRVN